MVAEHEHLYYVANYYIQNPGVSSKSYLTPRVYLPANPKLLLFSTTALHFLIILLCSVLTIQNKPTQQNRGEAQI